MKQQAMTRDIMLVFPEKGIDLSTSLDNQRPGTTPVCVNAKLYDAKTDRARGGSRPGLVKFIATQLPL